MMTFRRNSPQEKVEKFPYHNPHPHASFLRTGLRKTMLGLVRSGCHQGPTDSFEGIVRKTIPPAVPSTNI